MAGRIDFYFIPLAAAASTLASGKLTVIVSVAECSLVLPDVPSVAEAGYPATQSTFWIGLSAPAKHRPTIHKLHDAVEKALQTSAVKEKLANVGMEPALTSVEQSKDFFDIARHWSLPRPLIPRPRLSTRQSSGDVAQRFLWSSPMSPWGLGCVKTQMRLLATEESFVQVVDSRANVSQRGRFRLAWERSFSRLFNFSRFYTA
jgi:hypothetical protein